MKKVAQLKDGTDVLIRSLRKKDTDKSLAFFQALPAEDRKYLRRDVTKREVVKERINTMKSGRVKRLVAELDNEIIAECALELETYEWKSHISEIRLIVAHPFHRKGLGTLLAHELYWLAAKEDVEQIVVKMMGPQIGARRIFEKLGFKEDITLSEYVKDQSGSKQDLIIMRCNLQILMKEMEDYFIESDWQRTR